MCQNSLSSSPKKYRRGNHCSQNKVIQHSDNRQSCRRKAALKQIGLRPGEKLYETMVTRYDSFRTIETNDSYIIVPPYADTAKYCQHYSALPVSPEFEFNSENNPNQYTVAEIKQMIKSM